MPFLRKIDKFVHHIYFIEHVPGREEPLRLHGMIVASGLPRCNKTALVAFNNNVRTLAWHYEKYTPTCGARGAAHRMHRGQFLHQHDRRAGVLDRQCEV